VNRKNERYVWYRTLRQLLVTGAAATTVLCFPSSGKPQTAPPTISVAPVAPAPAAQNPSPMLERTRAHQRISTTEVPGIRRSFTGPLGKPVELFITPGTTAKRGARLVIHFFGAAFIPQYAVSQLGAGHIVAVVNIGSGSGIYDRTFSDPAVFDALLTQIHDESAAALGAPTLLRDVTLAAFSAGHGAIREVLRDSAHFDLIHGVLLLDGMHTSYVPEGVVLDKGGHLDDKNLIAFAKFARAATRGDKRMLVTHSEIFPGTFASTTECADYIIDALSLTRTPVLRWGPRGMQQLSDVANGGLHILGFAGNSAPDHIDQFHGMPEFLRMIER